MSRRTGHRRPPPDARARRSRRPESARWLGRSARREAAVTAIGARVRLLVSGPENDGSRDHDARWPAGETDPELRLWADERAPGSGTDTRSRSERPRLRFAPTRSAGVAVGTVAALVAAISFWWVLSDRPRSLAIGGGVESSLVVTSPHPSAAAVDQAPASAAAASGSVGGSASLQNHPTASAPSTGLQVDVVGKVAHPGVVTVAAGARVIDAITAAGGALPGVDLTALNLARRVSDGEQIAVGVAGASDAVPPPSADSGTAGVAAGSSAGSSARVNLNSATATELDALPGVGPALAKNIIDWRTAHGRFTSVDQLREVSGIGTAKFASLKNVVTV